MQSEIFAFIFPKNPKIYDNFSFLSDTAAIVPQTDRERTQENVHNFLKKMKKELDS